MSRTRVLLADDHALVRAGVRSLLGAVDGVEVVGEAGDGHEALEMIERLKPDVVLMDVMMPGLNGLEAAARVAKKHPRVRVLVLSMNSSEEHVLQALRAGAAGYILKTVSVGELELALKAVSQGQTYLSPSVSKAVIEDYLRRVGEPRGLADRLTPRQREVLQLVAEGHSTKKIAHKLGVSVKTVEMHRSQLLRALEVRDVTGLVRFAIRAGIVSPDR